MKLIALFLTTTILTILSAMPCSGGEYTNYIRPGTSWEVRISVPAYPPRPSYTYIETYTVNDTVIDNRNCLTVKSENDGIECAQLYVNEDKVWILSNDLSEWQLLYDFGLQSGKDCIVSVKGYDILTNIIYKTEGYFSKYPDIRYLDVYEQYTEIPLDDNQVIRWIPGIGSEKGLLQNAGIDLVGDYGSKLLKVEYGGATIYEDNNTESNIVDNVSLESLQDSAVYDIIGRKMAHPEGRGIFIINDGKKVMIK